MANVSELTTDGIVAAILAPRSKDELARLVNQARAADGRVVGSVAWDDDDICPRFKFPFPPRAKFQDFLNGVSQEGRAYRVFPMGILGPDELIVDVRARAYQV